MTQHLDLDPEQQQAIRAVLERYATQLTALQAEVEETSQRLPEAYADPAIRSRQFQQLTAEASAARVQLDSLSAVMLVAEAAVLTPEQRQKFAEVAPSIHSQPKRPPGQGRTAAPVVTLDSVFELRFCTPSLGTCFRVSLFDSTSRYFQHLSAKIPKGFQRRCVWSNVNQTESLYPKV